MSLKNTQLVGFGGRVATAPARVPNTKTPTFCCGFECGRTYNSTGHFHFGSNTSVVTTPVKTGTYSARINPTNGISAGSIICQDANANISIYRFYIRFATMPSHSTYITFVSGGGANDIMGVAYNTSDQKLYCARGSNPTFAAAGVSVTTGVWYRIDVKMNQTSGSKAVDAQVNGAALTQQTQTGVAAPDKISVGTGQTVNVATADFYIDDFVLSNTSADYPIGAGHIDHFKPTADGTHNTGTAGSFITGAAGANITNATTTSFGLIDEIPVDDTTIDTNDYITQTNDTGGGALYVEHVFGPGSGVSTPSVGPRAVDVLVMYAAAATGTSDNTFKLNDNGTENTVFAFSGNASTGVRYGRKHYANAPSDSNAWGVTGAIGNFNNLKHRWGYVADGNPNQYFVGVIIEAEFADP